MTSQLGAARLIADHVRFTGDYFRKAKSRSGNSLGDVYFSQDSIQITEQVTPDLARSIEVVRKKLSIPESAIKAYVYASPEIQAYCVSDGADRCFIRFSSGLIGLLEPAELEFVAGHELGHFLLSHSIGAGEVDSGAYEMKMLQRAQEISADRLGLLACGSIDVSIRALMKTVSGLPSEHLRFDVGEFISQIRKLKGEEFLGQGGSSHPSMLVRCRALLWFSMSNAVKDCSVSEQRPADLDDLDRNVGRDLNDYVDGPERKEVELLKTHVSMWLAAEQIVSDGMFDKHEQEKFSKLFGVDNLRKFKSFLGGFDASEVKKEVNDKLSSAIGELNQVLPYSGDKEISGMKKSILESF